MKKPETLNILGVPHKVTYCENPADVDIHKRNAYFGEYDSWTRSIRIYVKDQPIEEVWSTIFEEVLHGFYSKLKLNILDCDDKEKGEQNHKELHALSTALTDFLFRNNLIKLED